MQMNLDGKTAVVTGASSGIGAGIAEALAAAGARLILVGRDQDRLNAVTGKITVGGAHAVPYRTDLARPEAADGIIETALRHGGLDVIVNAAGLFEVGEADDGLASLDRQWQVNVRAPFNLTRRALPAMRPGGAVLFMSSIAGVVGFAGASAYSTTKGAVENAVRALALDAAPHGIRVNAIAPGNIRTAMNEDVLADPGYEREMIDRTPLGRIGVVEDITPAAVFLVSDAASYITGTSLLIDGGWTAS
jgi:NAD(P)-dependent dehydrogenase (short-subunit alcohol dehydrogenase family)